MNDIELAVHQALQTQGGLEEANKAYLEFIKGNFILPIDKNSSPDYPEVLYLRTEHEVFLPVFSHMRYFDSWAVDIQDEIHVLHLTGVNLLQGVGEKVTISFNIGTALYKEFNPGEIARMRSMILKLGLIKT
jgi:hypothetical protein